MVISAMATPIEENELILTLFKPIIPPLAEPPSADEKRAVHHYRTLRARIHDGPLYSVIGDNVRVSKSGRRSPPAAHFDPFEGQPTYTQRYKRKKNTLPDLSKRPFSMIDLLPDSQDHQTDHR
jgi:DNA-directed RNA polymerase III subunit RPC7